MLAEEKLNTGELEEALALLQDQVRSAPNNTKYRIFLFQLLSVLGRWERALGQLRVAGDLDPANLAMVQTYRETLACEVLRDQVFKGQRAPMWFGEPEEWMAFQIEALQLVCQGKIDEARGMRERAFDAAPTTKGTVNGEPFEWIADADSRLGPVLEIILNGHYYWMPFHRLLSIQVEPPSDLRDLVWMPATVVLATGAEMVAFIPTRYAGSEQHTEGAIRLARRTDWKEEAGACLGLGQRMFVTDVGDYPLLDVRQIHLGTPPEASAEPTTGAHG